MFIITNHHVTFTYTLDDLRKRLQELSAHHSVVLAPPTPTTTPTDAYAITDDEAAIADQMLEDSAIVASEEFDKIGRYDRRGNSIVFSAPCTDAFVAKAPAADAHLENWLVWHALTQWFRLKHLDKSAAMSILHTQVYFSGLHSALFHLRN